MSKEETAPNTMGEVKKLTIEEVIKRAKKGGVPFKYSADGININITYDDAKKDTEPEKGERRKGTVLKPLTRNQRSGRRGFNYYGLTLRLVELRFMDAGNEKERLLLILGREFLQAAARGNVEKLRTFIDEGFSINYQSPENGLTALHRAAAAGARGTVLVLLKAGKCDHLIKDRQNRFASEHAFIFGDDEAMSRLLGWKEGKQLQQRKSQP